MGPGVDLLGCEYLGGCPAVGSRVLNKVELHFAEDGLTVAVAPQGLFTLAYAKPVLVLAWSDITVLSATTTRTGPTPLKPLQFAHAIVNVLRMRLDLPDQLAIGTSDWTMKVGVRLAADELALALNQLLTGHAGPKPAITAGRSTSSSSS